jgi:transmembrane sensor
LKLDSKHIDYLISRYLSGEASADETLLLEKWMDESKSNKKYFEGIKFVNDKAVAAQPVIKFDADAAWEKLHKKMANLPAKKKPKVITIKLQTVYRIALAASVALLLGLSYFVYRNISTGKGASNYVSIVSNAKVERLSLDDNSKIVLNKNSKVEYSKNFGKKNREVKLTGEAYFNVEHNEDKPFIVKVENALIEDIGTAFNIMAIPDSAFIEVYVDSGEVRFYSPTNPGVTLIHGETAIYDKSTDIFKKIISVDEKKLSYKYVFYFNDARLADAVEKINEVYPKKLKISNKRMENCRITVVFNNEDFETIVNIITETLGIKSTRQSYGYLLDGTGCDEK